MQTRKGAYITYPQMVLKTSKTDLLTRKKYTFV